MTSFNSTYYTGNTPQKIPVPEDSSGGEDLFAALEHLKQFADKELLEENAKLKSELEEFQKDAAYHTREKRMLAEENEQLRRENERLREQNNGASDETTIGEDCLQLGSDLTRTDIADATASGTNNCVSAPLSETDTSARDIIAIFKANGLNEKFTQKRLNVLAAQLSGKSVTTFPNHWPKFEDEGNLGYQKALHDARVMKENIVAEQAKRRK